MTMRKTERVRHQVTKVTIFQKILMKIHNLLSLMTLYVLKDVIRLETDGYIYLINIVFITSVYFYLQVVCF